MSNKYELKKAYGLECLCFDSHHKMIQCSYVGDNPEIEDNIDFNDLDWLLKALSIQQGNVYFTDAKKICTGIDEIKQHYLVMRLSGL